MKPFIIWIFLLIPLALTAQRFSVTGFYENTNDKTAEKEGTKIVINYNELCALIKVQTTQKGFVFDGGYVGVESVDDSREGEIWVYVPAGLQSLTILHNKLGILRDYEIPESLQPGHTYIMTLSTQGQNTHQQQAPQNRPAAQSATTSSQWFVLTYEPKNANIMIDGITVEGSNGKLSKMLSSGRHEIIASADRHHTLTTLIDIESDKKEFTLKLRHAFGWLHIAGPEGASVFLDGVKIGNAPLKTDTLASVAHNIMVTKANHLPYKERITVIDDSTLTILPELQPNFTKVTLRTDADAEIWVNNEKRGRGRVTVDLAPGEYSFESRKDGHRSNSVVRYIELSADETIELPSPVAVAGSLSIDARPIGAKLYIDGVYKGETPLLIDDILIGQHQIRLTYSGYPDATQTVEITEGKMSEVTITMKKAETVAAVTPAPATVTQQEKPVVVPQQEKPAAVTQQEKPAVVTQQEKPVVVTQQEKPVVVTQQEKPAAVPQQEKPAVVTQQEKPAAVPQQEKPAVVPQQERLETTGTTPPPPDQVPQEKLSSRLNLDYIREDSAFSTTADGAFVENGILHKVPSDFSGNYMTGENITGIKDWAFSGCTNLTGITITSNVRTVGKYVFKGCPNLKTVRISPGVTSIGDNTFQSCKLITSIQIPGSVTSIATRLFFDCTGLRKVVLSEGVLYIGNSAFFGCDKLPNITLPESLRSIGDKAFSGCNSLTSITIPASVQSIGKEAFAWSTNLNSVTFAGNVAELSPDAISHCKQLTTIYVPTGSKGYYQNLLPQEYWGMIVEK